MDTTINSATPTSTPSRSPAELIPRDSLRHEALAGAIVILMNFNVGFGICLLALTGAVESAGIIIFLLFLMMGLTWLVIACVLHHGNFLMKETEKRRESPSPVACGSVGAAPQVSIGTTNSESSQLLPFSQPHRIPVNVPEALYVQLHRPREPRAGQPIANIVYYMDIGADGPAEKFLRRCFRIVTVIFSLFNIAFIYKGAYLLNIPGGGVIWLCLIVLVAIAYDKWLYSLPMWLEIRQVEGASAITLEYGAISAMCGHCGQKVAGKGAGRELGETIETLV